MAESACYLSLLMNLRSHNTCTCNQGNKYMEICKTINLKYLDYSSFFMAFDVATVSGPK